MDDPRIERERIAAAFARLDALGDCGGATGAAAMLVTTTTVDMYPTTAGAFYATSPTELDGDEVEGGSATPTVDATQTVFAWNAGSTVPPTGSKVIIEAVGGRWVFRWDS